MTRQNLPGFTAEASLAKPSQHYVADAAWTLANPVRSGEIVPQVGGPNCHHVNQCVAFCCGPWGCEYIDFC
jgi:hypothetical protein